MRKLIAAINMTLDGVCDHTAVSPDAQIHQHYADLLDNAGAILYGRTTYQLMQFWQQMIENPSGDQTMDDFAQSMDKVPKIVFSRTLQETGWQSARLAQGELEQEVLRHKNESGNDLFVGSPSLIVSLLNARLIDELQLCVHPVLAGGGQLLFQNMIGRQELSLIKTKNFESGAIILYYHP